MSETSLLFRSAAPARSMPALASMGGKGGFDALRGRVTYFLRQPAIAKSLPMCGLLAVIGIAALAWLALREPPQRDLFRGLPESDKAAVAEALGASNIAFDLDDMTGALTVSESDYHKAKMLLAAEEIGRAHV